jgi:hypothetical protein
LTSREGDARFLRPYTQKKYHNQKKCEWQSNIVLSSDAPFSVSETYRICPWRASWSIFLSSSHCNRTASFFNFRKNSTPQMKNTFYVSRAKNKKNGLDSKIDNT